MASARNYLPSAFQFPSSAGPGVEFQESDIWSAGDGRVRLISQASIESHLKNQIPTRPPSWKRSTGRKISSVSARSSSYSPALASSSLPVNVPDWTKILGQFKPREGGDDPEPDFDGSDDEDEWIPPHEYAARQAAKRTGKVVAFSVQEGGGGALKGRDLWRVRSAILKQTGFED